MWEHEDEMRQHFPRLFPVEDGDLRNQHASLFSLVMCYLWLFIMAFSIMCSSLSQFYGRIFFNDGGCKMRAICPRIFESVQSLHGLGQLGPALLIMVQVQFACLYIESSLLRCYSRVPSEYSLLTMYLKPFFCQSTHWQNQCYCHSLF